MSQKILRDDLRLCEDCHLAAAGVDSTIVDQNQAKAVEDGLTRLGEIGHLAPDHDSESGAGVWEHSRCKCDCCGSGLGGSRHRYVILGGA